MAGSTGSAAMAGADRVVARACRWALLGIVLAMGTAKAAPSPLGTWQIENGRGVIAIAQCGDALCGRIVGIDRDPGTPMPTDVHGRSQCGLTIITDATRSDDGAWFGQITDPRSGNTYQAKLWVDDQGNLNLRGYLGIPLFGQTQVWRPYTGELSPECDLA